MSPDSSGSPGTGPAPTPARRALARLLPLVAAAVAAPVLLQNGLRGWLTRDDAALLYAGQQLAEGIPPYRSVATLKGPLAQLVAGSGVAAARAAGWDDVLTVRVLFLLAALVAVALVARLGQEVLGSRRGGFIAALVLAGGLGSARLPAGGPRYATVMLVFLALGLLQTERRRWFSAAAAGSLAYLTWQPAALLPAATLLLAGLEPRRARALAAAATGAAAPVALVTARAAARGILGELALRIFLFDLPYLKREPRGLGAHLRVPLETVERVSGRWMLAATAAALVAVLLAAVARRRGSASWAATLRDGRGSVLLLTFPGFLLWSLLDFQGYGDFYPLLPGIAVGSAGLLELLLAAVGGGAGRWLSAAAAACLLLGAFTVARSTRAVGLDEQAAAAREIVRRYPQRRLVSIGDPVALVVLRRRNPNPYLFIEAGTDGLIARRTPGGFDAWLEGLRAEGPLVVLGGRMHGQSRSRLRRWLRRGFRREWVGPLRIFVERTG